MEILNLISNETQKGQALKVKELVAKALSDGIDAKLILNEGLLKGMMILGDKFKKNEAFVPEVLIAARAMNEGTKILEGELLKAGIKPIGKAVIGTVKGDLHDIGKNLVGMMLKGAGIEVIDLGVNCDADKYITAAEEHDANLIVLSALLTTTMPYMEDVIKTLNNKGIRNNYKVMIGGAPVNEDYCKKIGADFFTTDATSCAEKAREIILNK